MNLEEAIESLTMDIEAATNNKVRYNVVKNHRYGASLDFGNWINKLELPLIILLENIREVHRFHELLHIKQFFIDQYSLIATNHASLLPVLDVYKNIPEDYVVHKIIKHEYDFDPIDRSWFLKAHTTGLAEQDASTLVNYHNFIEFCPEFETSYYEFSEKVRRDAPKAYGIATSVLETLEKMNIYEKESYDKCADEIIKAFSPSEYGLPREPRSIYIAHLLKKPAGMWDYNR
jgi:hypothetical protein